MRGLILLAPAAMLIAAAPAAGPVQTQITAPGPKGALVGTLTRQVATVHAVAVILPGSGPTDRDGNSPAGVRAAPYRLLAEALAERGIVTVQIDKRGLGGSVAAGDGNAVTLDAYATDTRAWIGAALAATGARCVWLIGHSEGGLISLKTAADTRVCGLVLIATPGRKLGEVMRSQLRANPYNGPILADAFHIISEFEAGRTVPEDKIAAPLRPLFPAATQGYLIELTAFDPARSLAGVRKPVLIVSGTRDLQVGREDADALIAADPRAKLAVIDQMNHVLKRVTSIDPAVNVASYADPDQPLAPGLVDAVARFVGDT